MLTSQPLKQDDQLLISRGLQPRLWQPCSTLETLSYYSDLVRKIWNLHIFVNVSMCVIHIMKTLDCTTCSNVTWVWHAHRQVGHTYSMLGRMSC